MRDVARMELGAQDYTLSGRINGKPGAIIAVYQLPGKQCRGCAKGVRKLMEEAQASAFRRMSIMSSPSIPRSRSRRV